MKYLMFYDDCGHPNLVEPTVNIFRWLKSREPDIWEHIIDELEMTTEELLAIEDLNEIKTLLEDIGTPRMGPIAYIEPKKVV